MSKLLRISGIIFLAFSLSLSTDNPLSTAGEKDKKVRLFILSGQSNMVGLNPNVSFTPTVKKAFPDDEVIVIKDAQGGQPIRRWFKNWKPPEGIDFKDKKKNGTLYDRLMQKVRKTIDGKKVDTVSFVWMQGERDAKTKLSAVYEESLRGLVQQLRKDLKRPDITVVIGRLSDHLDGNKHWDKVRAAQVKVAETDPLADWVDTDDLNGPKDGLHYNKEGYAELGERFADKTIALLRKKNP